KDHLFASVSGVTDKGWLYFSGGFITHSPFRAKYYSPGYLQIVMLSQLLTKEGMTGVDLSPGGDSYKDRLASRYEDVHELLITNNPLYYLKRKLRYKYFKKLEKAGKRPMSVELAWKKRKYLLKARLQKAKQEGLFRFAAKKLNQYIHPPKELIYVATTATLKNTAAMSVNKNNLRDMLCFVSKGTAMSRWEFLEDAMSRYENGECSYTYCYEGQLLGCVWVAEKQKANADKNIASDPTIELHQFYCHPTGESRHKEFLGTVATLITQERKSETIYAIASNEDKTLCKALEQVGFKVDA
ncbi:MAG TPA: hypothetical protein VD794_13615, partial [Flavisolibacter sp.]|nr:hypothetical protein [Flavisolibacter sp.]